jgi:hypothetical protein
VAGNITASPDSLSSLVCCNTLLKRSLAHHHHQKLVVVHLSVVIRIHSLQHFVDLILAQSKVLTCETLAQLLPADRATPVLVEVGEGGTQVVLLQVGLAVHAGRNKLSVVN